MCIYIDLSSIAKGKYLDRFSMHVYVNVEKSK